MKIIPLLFALYVFFLSVYPCSDGNTCVDEQKSGIALVDNTNHDHTSGEQDSCTPFCICACCAAHIQLNYIPDFFFATLVHNTELSTLYFEKPLLENAKAIWQPPRV